MKSFRLKGRAKKAAKIATKKSHKYNYGVKKVYQVCTTSRKKKSR